MFSTLIAFLLFLLLGCIWLAVTTAIHEASDRKEMGIRLPEDDQ
jgi:hypothetical protein